jgi:hypothetical protein
LTNGWKARFCSVIAGTRSHLDRVGPSSDQSRNLVAELERRFRDEALTSATLILDGVKADRWRASSEKDASRAIHEMIEIVFILAVRISTP